MLFYIKDTRSIMVKKANIIVHVVTNIEKALRKLKKTCEREGIVRDLKKKMYFEPRPQKRRKSKVRAIKHEILRQMAQKR